ncbi:MAG: hypothetical protein FD126_325 [Elusimicrobia bacterium]|nr:MAG: hypothetical protein FD126_325 [Elusimicrobiota bacterium]
MTPVMTAVIQPPSRNFSWSVTPRMQTHMTRPVPWMASRLRQRGSEARWVNQCRDIPSSVSEKVRKTLIEYMTTSIVMLPFV